MGPNNSFPLGKLVELPEFSYLESIGTVGYQGLFQWCGSPSTSSMIALRPKFSRLVLSYFLSVLWNLMRTQSR